MEKETTIKQIVEDHQEQLFRFAFFRVGSTDQAMDIVQDVFVRLFTKQDLASIGNMKAYLFRSVSNSCADFHKSRGRNLSVSLNEEVLKIENEEAAVAEEEYLRIEQLMSELPEEQSGVIKMRTIDNLRFGEIADILGLPESTIKSRFRYGIEKLRTKMN